MKPNIPQHFPLFDYTKSCVVHSLTFTTETIINPTVLATRMSLWASSIDVRSLPNCSPDHLSFSKCPFQHQGFQSDEWCGLHLVCWAVPMQGIIFLHHLPCCLSASVLSLSHAFHVETSLTQIGSLTIWMEPIVYHRQIYSMTSMLMLKHL